MDLFENILKNSFTIVLKNKILFENLNMKKGLNLGRMRIEKK